jgi:hypothetical protein
MKVEIPNKPDDADSGEIITEYDYKKFIDWATGYLMIKLGEGDFRGGVITILDIAQRKGKYNYQKYLITHNQIK